MLFTFLLVVHALISASLVAVILMQRSEGGGLGMGGGPSGLMTARGAADFLTRATTVLATLFVLLSIGLAALATFDRGPSGDIDMSLAHPAAPVAPPSTAPVPAADPLAVANAPGAGPEDATHVPTGPVKLPVPGPGSAPGVSPPPPAKASVPAADTVKPAAAMPSPSPATVPKPAPVATKPAAPASAPAAAPTPHLPIVTPPSASPKSSAPAATPPAGQ